MVDLRAEFILGLDEINEDKLANVDISMLDYDYVNKCNDAPTLKNILKVLISGKEGKYPHLETTVIDKILDVLPVKERKRIISMSNNVSLTDIEHHSANLYKWVEETFAKPQDISSASKDTKQPYLDSLSSNGESNVQSGNFERYPPIRSATKSAISISGPRSTPKTNCTRPSLKGKEKSCQKKDESDVIPKPERISKESLSNRDYFRAWDKFDYEAAEKDVDADEDDDEAEAEAEVEGENQNHGKKEKTVLKGTPLQDAKLRMVLDKQATRTTLQLDEMRKQMNYHSLSETERKFMASREKCKGNECFRNKEYEESHACYTRSLALDDQNAIVYANRAMVCIKLSNLCQAVSDCTQALLIDPDYTKALARRGMVHHQCGRFLDARKDFSVCVNQDPSNKEYAKLLKLSTEKYNEVKGEEKHEKTKKKVVIIQDDDDSESDTEVIEEIYTPGSLQQMQK